MSNYKDLHATGKAQQQRRHVASRNAPYGALFLALCVVLVVLQATGLITIGNADVPACSTVIIFVKFALTHALTFLLTASIIFFTTTFVVDGMYGDKANRASDERARRRELRARSDRRKLRTERGILDQLIDAGFTREDAAEAQKHSSTLQGCTAWLNSADALEGRLRRAGFSAVDAGAALRHVPHNGGETQFAACLAWLYAPSAVRNMTAAEKAARGRRGLKSFLSMKSRKWSGKVSLLDIDCAMKRSSTVRGCVAWIESELERRRKHESELKWRHQHKHGIVGGRQMGKTAIAEFSSMRQIGKTEAAKEQMKAELIQDLIFDDDMPALVESSDSDGDSDESGEGDCMISFAACLEQSCSTQVDDDHMPVLDSRDVELVMQQAGVLRAAAVKALRANDGDVVNAIMDLVMVPTKAVEEEDIID